MLDVVCTYNISRIECVNNTRAKTNDIRINVIQLSEIYMSFYRHQLPLLDQANAQH